VRAVGLQEEHAVEEDAEEDVDVLGRFDVELAVADGAPDPLVEAPVDRALHLLDHRLDPRRQLALDVGRRQVEDGHDVGLLPGELDGQPEVVGELALEARRALEGRHAGLRPHRHALLDQVDQQLLLGAVVVVEARLGDADPLGDLVHRGAVVALLAEQLEGGSADALPRRGGFVQHFLCHQGLLPTGRKLPTGR